MSLTPSEMSSSCASAANALVGISVKKFLSRLISFRPVSAVSESTTSCCRRFEDRSSRSMVVADAYVPNAFDGTVVIPHRLNTSSRSERSMISPLCGISPMELCRISSSTSDVTSALPSNASGCTVMRPLLRSVSRLTFSLANAACGSSAMIVSAIVSESIGVVTSASDCMTCARPLACSHTMLTGS